MDTTQALQIHTFDDTTDAYGACQVGETYDTDGNEQQVNTGDVLLIDEERVVGICDTWPIAVTVAHGELHAMGDYAKYVDNGSSFGTDSIIKAVGVAAGKGYEVADWALEVVFAASHPATLHTPEPTVTTTANQVNAFIPYTAETTSDELTSEVLPYINGGVRVVVSDFSRDLNGNAVAHYTVYRSNDAHGWGGIYAQQVYRTGSRKQIGFGGWCDEYTDSALSKAGLLPTDYIVVNRSGSRSDGQVCLDYLPRDVVADSLERLSVELLARGVSTPAQLERLERSPIREHGVWRARV